MPVTIIEPSLCVTEPAVVLVIQSPRDDGSKGPWSDHVDGLRVSDSMARVVTLNLPADVGSIEILPSTSDP